ncbi:UNVERIFIED_CONTAM: putative late blight resistance proteinR1A-10 [Sesamum latifolium]|uniref:Late blight resistance proteinR1A-10 n=1 Tax=Sesamum latifolium TaxID=2727402 RepID=A0AAW2XCP1_9LAMI
MCFLYTGVFPEDYQIPVSKLVRLWAAERFLKPCADESLDDVGEKYLQDLTDRSIVLVNKRKLSGKIRTCSIHDLVRDLCVREAQKEKDSIIVVREHLEFKEVFFPDYPDFRVTEDVYKSIPNVKKLEIVYDKNSNTTEWSLYCLDNFVHLHQLESLKCHFLDAHGQKPDLPDLTFPSKLKELSLLGWGIPSKYMTTIGSLHNLEILKLRFCSLQDDEWKLSEGEYYRLKILVLEGMNIVQWRAETDHFPSLEQLIIKHCRKLEEIPPGFGDIPTLQLIKVVGGSRSCENSAMQILQDQQSLGNCDLKVIT